MTSKMKSALRLAALVAIAVVPFGVTLILAVAFVRRVRRQRLGTVASTSNHDLETAA